MDETLKKTIAGLDEHIRELSGPAESAAESPATIRAMRNAASAVGDAITRLHEISRELARETQVRTERMADSENYRMVGIYAMRSEPDYVIFDVDLGTGRAIGSPDEYDCLGRLPLELHEVAGSRRVRRMGDAWRTRPAVYPPGPQDCAIELTERAGLTR